MKAELISAKKIRMRKKSKEEINEEIAEQYRQSRIKINEQVEYLK